MVSLEPDGHPFIHGTFQLDDESNFYIGNGWKSPNIHFGTGWFGGFQVCIYIP